MNKYCATKSCTGSKNRAGDFTYGFPTELKAFFSSLKYVPRHLTGVAL